MIMIIDGVEYGVDRGQGQGEQVKILCWFGVHRWATGRMFMSSLRREKSKNFVVFSNQRCGRCGAERLAVISDEGQRID